MYGVVVVVGAWFRISFLTVILFLSFYLFTLYGGLRGSCGILGSFYEFDTGETASSVLSSSRRGSKLQKSIFILLFLNNFFFSLIFFCLQFHRCNSRFFVNQFSALVPFTLIARSISLLLFNSHARRLALYVTNNKKLLFIFYYRFRQWQIFFIGPHPATTTTTEKQSLYKFGKSTACNPFLICPARDTLTGVHSRTYGNNYNTWTLRRRKKKLISLAIFIFARTCRSRRDRIAR